MKFHEVFVRTVLICQHLLMRIVLALRNDVVCGPGVTFRGFSTMDCRNGGRIRIGKGTVLNSSNFGYHVNMFARCKLIADRPNALIEIGENCRIHGAAIHAQSTVRIGNGCLIAANAQIFDGNGHDLCLDNPEGRIKTTGMAKPITIGNNVWIGTGAIILPGTTIGDGSIIGAAAVVRGDISARTIAAGNPAVVLHTARTDRSQG